MLFYVQLDSTFHQLKRLVMFGFKAFAEFFQLRDTQVSTVIAPDLLKRLDRKKLLKLVLAQTRK